jgi:uncharacterized protein (TIGR03503 family)
MIHPLKMIWLLMALALLMPLRQVFAMPTAPVSDIRVLIDVSGSMKKNDPNNLRAPALRLIVGLLPNDSMAGTWTFGKYVNMLVPLREVNDAWKLEAELQSKNIHSYGLFTNIEQALNKATANQKRIDPRYRRSVILLSDGLVDVSKDDKINKISRQRILDDIVPRLKKNNVAVHTIALSNSADHNLLRAISLATDGWYEQVDNADQLQRVFLHLFEKAATRDTVPLVENQFKIDNSVSEMTLLVFRREGSKLTELLLPNQSRISLKKIPNNVRWHSEGNYDLITIDKPLVGQWQIDAEIDPDNRVMVVTDLKLKTTDLPNNILIGETFDFDVSLTDKNKLIARQDFLKLVDAQLKEESANADPIQRSLNEEQKKGIYRTHVGENFQPGQNDVVITMTSATFERQRRQSINVVETPFEITVEQLTDKATRTHRLTLADLQIGEKYTVALQIRAQTVKGRPLFLQPAVIELLDDQAVTKNELPKTDPITPEMENETPEKTITPEVSDEQQANVADQEVEKTITERVIDEMSENADSLLPEVTDEAPSLLEAADKTEQQGLSTASQLAIGNGLLLLMIGLGVFFWRRKSATSTNPGEQL